MNIKRFFAMFDLVVRGHILNWFWRPRNIHHQKRLDVVVDVTTRYFKRYLPKNVPVQKIVHNDKGEKIYSMWLQGEENAPKLVRSCFDSVRKNAKNELIVLDENSVFDYITLPQIIVDKYKAGKIPRAHFADICRVELLYEHGGYWLDATGFVTEQIPDFIQDSDFFMFLINPGWGFGYSFIQNCFIRAKKGSYLLAAWREMIFNYWKNENHTFDYFMHQLIFKTLVMNDEKSKEYFAKMPHVSQDPTHVLWAEYRDKKFDKSEFDEITKDAFFQKLTYRGSESFLKDSYADIMINKPEEI